MNRRNDQGVAAVEFALVVSLLIMLLLGIVTFGLAFFTYQGLQAAAREGARYAAIEPDQVLVRQRVDAALDGVVGNKNLVDMIVDPNCGPAEVVRVSLAYPYELSVPFWKNVEFDMRTVGEFRCER